MIQDNRFELKQTPAHIWVGFSTEHPVLSSAVFNGGACAASNILIMKVAENFEGTKKVVQTPENTLAEYCKQLRTRRNNRRYDDIRIHGFLQTGLQVIPRRRNIRHGYGRDFKRLLCR
jgi:hypothetical protein